MIIARLVLALAAITATTAVPAHAAGLAAGPAAKTLTVVADRTGSGTITLSTDSVINADALNASPDIAIEGRGRLIGVLLNRLGEGDQPSLLVYRTNLCAAPACAEAFPEDALEFVTGAPFTRADDGTGSLTLPAGTYAVTAVADGAPVTVTLALDGLSEATTLRPSGAASVQYDALDPTVLPAGAPAGLVYSAGSTYETQRPSYIAFARTNETVAGGAAQADGTCLYTDGPPPGDLYTQFCPAIDGSDRVNGGGVQTVQDPNGLRLGAYGAFGPYPADDRFTVGQYVDSAVPIRNVFALQVVVEFGVAPPLNDTAAAAEPSGTGPSGAAQAQPMPRTASQLPATGGRGATHAAAVLLLSAGLLLVRRRAAPALPL